MTRTDDRHTSERLSAEPVIWLGTVRPGERSHNVPVWFAWHDPMVLIFSMPKTAKVTDLRLSPPVSLALDSADGGQDIVLAESRAQLIAGPDRHPHFLASKFDPRHGMSVRDVYWTPSGGGAGRTVPACSACAHKADAGAEPEMRNVEVDGAPVRYVNAGFALAYWGGFGFAPGLFTGFLLGQALAPHAFFAPGGDYGCGDFGGGDF